MEMNMFLNLVIIVLLIVALIYAMILNHRLSLFKESKKEILKAVQSFHEVTQNAETTLSQIKQSTQTISEQLKTEMNKANLLRDDLVLLMEKNAAHTRSTPLKETTTYTRPPAFVRPKKAAAPHPFEKNLDAYQSEAERELFEALQRLKGS